MNSLTKRVVLQEELGVHLVVLAERNPMTSFHAQNTSF